MTRIALGYRLGVFLMALLVLASCNRDASDEFASSSNKATRSADAVWVVDPADPGSNLPPVGRSLFDHLVTEKEAGTTVYRVPFPFTALLRKIEREIGASSPSALKRVLIPLNRSLQRHAATPEFFTYPRAVVGVDTEPPALPNASGLLLKDRLFLGYQEKAGIIEVISYNEAGGRFEFQVVKDYRLGGRPTVLYANRAVCTVCHQNHSPIFTRPLWEETNANPKIAALLGEQHRDYYGFPIHQGVDIPNALDEATDRANGLSLAQLAWEEGCEHAQFEDSVRCRADLLRSVLQYRLSGSRGFAGVAGSTPARVIKSWQARWPHGLLIPNPDIVNRNPFDFFQPLGWDGIAQMRTISSGEGRERPAFRAAFEPSVPRAPLDTWLVSEGKEPVMRVVNRLADFITEADARRIDDRLFQSASDSGTRTRRYEAQCRYRVRPRKGSSAQRMTVSCADVARESGNATGTFSMEGAIYLNDTGVAHGSIDHLVFGDGDALTGLEIIRGTVTRRRAGINGRLEVAQKASGFHARRPDGDAVTAITMDLDTPNNPGHAHKKQNETAEYAGASTVTVSADFSTLESAIDALARGTLAGGSDVLARKPFRRARVMAGLYDQLNLPPLTWCCLDDRPMPQAIEDVDPRAHADATSSDNAAMPAGITAFHRSCAECHHGHDPFPPNFLHGSRPDVESQLAQCAERIFFRLQMGRLPAAQRAETPMPPVPGLLRRRISPEQWPAHEDFSKLTAYVTEVLTAEHGTPPVIEDLISRGYDNLRACMPRARPVALTGAKDEP